MKEKSSYRLCGADEVVAEIVPDTHAVAPEGRRRSSDIFRSHLTGHRLRSRLIARELGGMARLIGPIFVVLCGSDPRGTLRTASPRARYGRATVAFGAPCGESASSNPKTCCRESKRFVFILDYGPVLPRRRGSDHRARRRRRRRLSISDAHGRGQTKYPHILATGKSIASVTEA